MSEYPAPCPSCGQQHGHGTRCPPETEAERQWQKVEDIVRPLPGESEYERGVRLATLDAELGFTKPVKIPLRKGTQYPTYAPQVLHIPIPPEGVEIVVRRTP